MRQKLKQEILYRIYVSVFRREKEIAVYKAAKSENDEMKMKISRDTAQFYHGAEWAAAGIACKAYEGDVSDDYKQFIRRQGKVEWLAEQNAKKKRQKEPWTLTDVMTYLDTVGLFVGDD